MKNLIIICFLTLQISSQNILSQTSTETNLFWIETTVADFSDNLFTNTIITNTSNGEVQFDHPMIKNTSDVKNNSQHRFISRNSSRNYSRTWYQSNNIYVQVYDSGGEELSGVLRANNIDGGLGQNSTSKVALMDNDYYLVVWVNLGYHPNGTDDNMMGQIFNSEHVKVGSNFQINDTTNFSARIPVIFANETDQTFWILYSARTNSGYKLHVQKRNMQGEKVGNTNLLETGNATINEMHPTVIDNNNNEFVVAWAGFDENSSNYLDIYTRRFANNGSPIGSFIKVNDDQLLTSQNQPDICMAENGNYLIVWSDMRDNESQFVPYNTSIYGQIFSTSGSSIGENFKINEENLVENFYPDADFNNNEFEISWSNYNRAANLDEIYVNKWSFDPHDFGNMVSSIYDTGPGGSTFNNILWSEYLPQNSSIKFRIKSSNVIDHLDEALWYGPVDTAGYYNISTGAEINSIHDNQRFIQYKAYFNANESWNTPILNSISISYSPSDTIPPAPPQNLYSVTGYSLINLYWDSNSEEDLANYLIFRGERSGQYDSEWTKIVSNLENSFMDSSALVGNTYFYSIVAVDSSNNHSDFSNEVSARSLGSKYYISNYGSVNGNGSYENPFLSINQAMMIAAYGDTLFVLPGIYSENINIINGVSLQSSSIGASILKSTQGDFFIKMQENSTLNGFTILHNQFNAAILCQGNSILVEDNIIIQEASTLSFGLAISCRFSSVEIVGNYVTNFHTGIEALGTSTNQSVLSIHNNIIECEWGVYFLFDCEAEIYNNTILIPNGQGIGVSAMLDNNIEVQNNIIAAESPSIGFGIENAGSFTTEIFAAYNNIWNIENEYEGEINVGSGNIAFDPLFVDFANKNFKLSEGSFCIDAGNPNTLFNDVDGSRNDIGAYGGPESYERPDLISSIKKMSVANTSGFPLDTITTFVSLDNPRGLIKASFSLVYNPTLLEPIGINLTTSTANFSIKTEVYDHGEISVSIESTEGINNENSKILEFLFFVNEDAASGDASPFSIENEELFDENWNKIFISQITNGVFIVNQGSESGNYVYVDLANEGIENGSRNNPYNTIEEGVDNASNGDTVVVAAGDYSGSIIMKENVYLKGAGAKVTKITAIEDNPIVTFEMINNSEVSGFTLQHPTNYPMGILILCDSSSPLIKKNLFIADIFTFEVIGVMCKKNSEAIIEDNAFINSGIYLSESNPVIKGNNFSDAGNHTAINCSNSSEPLITKNKILSGEALGIGIRVDEASPTITNNWIICNKFNGTGVVIENSDTVNIYNNIIEDSGSDGLGIQISNSSNINVTNNTVLAKMRGIIESNSASFIYNNIITGSNGFGIQVSNTTIMDYNDIWNNNENYYNCFPGVNDISDDPLFLNILQSNYNLFPNSPCIDAGHPSTQYNDIDGTRNDMGAFGGPNESLDWLNQYNSSLGIDSVEVIQADTINIMVKGSSINQIAEVDITITFDSKNLIFIDAKSTDITNTFSVTKSIIDNNTIKIQLNSPTGIIKENGNLLELVLAIVSSNKTNATIKFQQAKIKDVFSNERAITELKNGIININITGIKDENKIPQEFNLSQNYPNPFNPTTIIEYSLPKQVKVELIVYDLLGREVRKLINQEQAPGNYKFSFNSNGLASGVYFYRIKAGKYLITKKMLLLK